MSESTHKVFSDDLVREYRFYAQGMEAQLHIDNDAALMEVVRGRKVIAKLHKGEEPMRRFGDKLLTETQLIEIFSRIVEDAVKLTETYPVSQHEAFLDHLRCEIETQLEKVRAE